MQGGWFPQEAIEGLGAKRYVPNVVEIVYRQRKRGKDKD